MHMRLTVFRIGLIAVIIGSIWIGVVFSASTKSMESFNIDKTDSASMVLSLHGSGIGFYEIYSNQYDNSILVKVLDSHENYLGMKTVTNKETVNYFVFDRTGEYTLELTNLSSNPVQLAVEFGDTRYQEVSIPATMVLAGACLLVLAGYVRLKNYITAQPE